MRGLPPKFQYFYMSGAEAHNSKGEIVSERSSERPSTKKASSWLPRYVKPTLPSFPSCRECWDLACWGTGRNACATGRREFKRAGPANTIGTRTARRMPFVSQDEPALRGKTAAANQRRHGFLLVAAAEILACWGTDVIFTGACWRGLCYWKARGVSGRLRRRLLFCAGRLFRGRRLRVLFFARGSLRRESFRGFAGGFVLFGRRRGRRGLSIGRVCRQRWR